MSKINFAECLTMFFTQYMPGRNISENTIKSYRDTFKLLFIFSETIRKVKPENITLDSFDNHLVQEFLLWLERVRKSRPSTINQRLAAIHAFVNYVKLRNPDFIFQNQRILQIKSKKSPNPELVYLQTDSVKAILAAVDAEVRYGNRDVVLLSLLYDSAARVQEIADLRIRDVRLNPPYTITLTGKGNKRRTVPLSTNIGVLLKDYIRKYQLDDNCKLDYPLFSNCQKGKMTRAGITYVLKKYCDIARNEIPEIPKLISPHVFRHSRAMHLLKAGINLIYIRDFLGHANVSTTEIYARADTEMKRLALEKANVSIETRLPDWQKNRPLMAMLKELCN